MRRIDLRGAPWGRIQPLRAPPRRHPARPRPVRAARRTGEGLRAQRREPVRATAAPVADRVRRVGARHVAGRQRAVDRHRVRAGDRRRCWRPTRGTPSSAVASRSSTWAGGRRRGPPTGPSSSAATAGRSGRRVLPADTQLRQAVGAGLDPCAVLQTSFELAAGERTEIVVAARPGRDARGGARSHPAERGADHDATLAEIASSRGTTSRRPSRCGPRTARWTSC